MVGGGGGGGGGGGVVQTDFRVKPTTKLLWVAFGLGCCCLAWLWGYDNSNQYKTNMGNSTLRGNFRKFLNCLYLFQ